MTSILLLQNTLLAFEGSVVPARSCIFLQVSFRTADLMTGWWHLVVNLSESIAVTQNFVPPAHLHSVLKFLKFKEDQISGFKNDVDAFTLFKEKLEKTYPVLLDKVDEEMSNGNAKKRKWLEDTEASDFSFDFFS